ncbi:MULTISPECIES: hypothetical protein [Mycolicibacter]|uniref:Uncharacterized protein n=2 Tax=Mycolicibacter TaxID=1073531 RepID=A0ABU5XM63_9MYCO|nr:MULTISPECIES: hypothetical protein [unclassified Mycolicibacter]MEB3023378.1 hypothetical protein [Mycolicibacter sp. MYC098]MEB3033720.1 hypothetical protein [Mycolicibacter sp. MYC340]
MDDQHEYRVTTDEGWRTWWANDAAQARQKHTEKHPDQTITSVRKVRWS